MALGAGSIPEEIFGLCYRPDCPTVKMLRHRALSHVLRLGVFNAPLDLLVAVDKTLRRIGYVADVRDEVVKEYAELMDLDVPINEGAATLLGAEPGQTLKELVEAPHDPFVDAVHMAAMAFYMEHIDGGDMRRLETLDFAAYAVLTMLQRGKMSRDQVVKLLSWVTDQALQA